ncbi:hypothetical protein, partial [Aequitasia blattaphilus]
GEVMKHFEIGITTGGTREFTFRCDGIHNAYDAINDAVNYFGLGEDMDEIMRILVKMDENKLVTHRHAGLNVYVRDGER